MSLEAHVSLVTEWLDSVDVESAPARMTAMQEQNVAKDTGGMTASARGEIARTAMHEASHAVVAYGWGLNVGRVCVREDASGSAAYEADEAQADAMLGAVLADLAGICCEVISGDADRARQFKLQHCHDVLAARLNADACRALAPGWALSNRTFAALAFCSVLSSWNSILRVAGALRLCRELDGAAIAALCGPLQ